MRVIFNDIIPFKGYKAMAIWPFIFVRNDIKSLSSVDINHEKIHLAQQLELFIIPFYLIYLIEWIIKGYRNISFEKEAYSNEHNLDYLKNRKHFSMWK